MHRDDIRRRHVEVEWEVDEENEDEVRWWEKEIWGGPGSHRIAFLGGKVSARAFQWNSL